MKIKRAEAPTSNAPTRVLGLRRSFGTSLHGRLGLLGSLFGCLFGRHKKLLAQHSYAKAPRTFGGNFCNRASLITLWS